MTILLVQGTTQVIDMAPITDTGTHFITNLHGTVPKTILAPWYGLVNVDNLPPDFYPLDYLYDPATNTVSKRIIPPPPYDPALRDQFIVDTETHFDRFVQRLYGASLHILMEQEKAARDYATSGYVDPVPDYVSVYASTRPGGAITNQQAATDLIAQISAKFDAEKAVHLQKLTSQGEMHAAANGNEQQAVIDAWIAWIDQKCTDLNLPLVTGQYMMMAAKADA